MDQDLQQLLEAWLSGEIDEALVAPLVERLKSDADFRKSFVDELAMLGQLKAVQSSEPRWLELEDLLATELYPQIINECLETRVMEGVAKSSLPGQIRNSHTRLIAALAGLAVAASIAAIVYWPRAGVEDELIAQPRIDSPGNDLTQVAIDDSVGTQNPESQQAPDTINNVSELANVDAIAVLSESVGVQWGGNRHPVVGDALQLGDLILESGTIEIDFLAGVRMLVRAPANIELRAADEVLLRHGTASCFVTEMGRGFRIVTSDMEVIDLGTAFSIEVEEGRQPEVHVLEGSVEIKSAQQTPMELREQHAIQMGLDGPKSVDFAPERFPQVVDLRDQQRLRDEQRYQQWKKSAATLSRDPSILLHYTFEEAGADALELTNQAADATHATNGMVIGCRWARGRWPSKLALLYRNASDRVLFQVPGAFDELTFMVWARVDALTQATTSLLMTENPQRRSQFASANDQSIADALKRLAESKVGTVRWELSQGQSNVMFSVGYGKAENWQYDKCPVENPSTHPDNWGNWVCLAVTCDVARREVIHYRNGQPIGTCTLENADPLLLDFMELGNFGATRSELEQSKGSSQRRFYGAFDEVVIAGRVMSAEEIESFWTSGKP